MDHIIKTASIMNSEKIVKEEDQKNKQSFRPYFLTEIRVQLNIVHDRSTYELRHDKRLTHLYRQEKEPIKG